MCTGGVVVFDGGAKRNSLVAGEHVDGGERLVCGGWIVGGDIWVASDEAPVNKNRGDMRIRQGSLQRKDPTKDTIGLK